MAKRVYTFGKGINEGRAEMKNLLGGKGANLAEMSNLGIPVPAGFTITTDVCVEFYKNNKQFPAGLAKEVETALKKVEKLHGSKIRRSGQSASVIRPLRRARLDAGHDGHRSQPWPE